VDQRILDYIQKELDKGFSKQQIIDTLARTGYKDDIIKDHIEKFNSHDLFYILVGVFVFVLVLSSVGFVIITDDPLERAVDLLYEGKHDEARQIYFHQLNKHADTAIYAALGYSYYVTKEYSKATEYYQKALELDPDNYNAWHELGVQHYETGNYEEASKHFGNACRLIIQNLEEGAYYHECPIYLAASYRRQGHRELSISALKDYRHEWNQPRCADFILFALIDEQNGNQESARRNLREAVEEGCNLAKEFY